MNLFELKWKMSLYPKTINTWIISIRETHEEIDVLKKKKERREALCYN